MGYHIILLVVVTDKAVIYTLGMRWDWELQYSGWSVLEGIIIHHFVGIPELPLIEIIINMLVYKLDLSIYVLNL